MMKTVGVAELNASLSSFLSIVKAGEEVLVTERGRPIARIVPAGAKSVSDHLASLVRRGLLRPAEIEAPLPARARVKDPEGRLLAALLDERREGR